MSKTVKLLLALFVIMFSRISPCQACYDNDDDYYAFDTDGDGEDDLWLTVDEDGHGVSISYWDDENGVVFQQLGETPYNGQDYDMRDDNCENECDVEDDENIDEEASDETEDILYDDIEDVAPDSPTRYYSTEQEIEWTKQISPEIREKLEELQKEGKIIEKANTTDCHYNAKEHCIYVPLNVDFTCEGLSHEVIHAKQDELHMLDSNYNSHASDNEYQAYVINYVLFKAYNGSDIMEPKGAEDTPDWSDFKSKMNDEIGKTDDHIWYSESFLDELKKLDHEGLSSAFREYYKEEDDERESLGMKRRNEIYYESHDEKYDWNWEELLNSVGFIKK